MSSREAAKALTAQKVRPASRLQSQQPAIVAVCQNIDVAIGALPDIAYPLAKIRQQLFLADNRSAVEVNTGKVLPGQRTDQHV